MKNRSFLASMSGVWLLLALVAFSAACPNWNRPKCPRAGVHSCAGNQPHYCAPGTGELTPIGDESCSAQNPPRVCRVDPADGIAFCGFAVDAGEVHDAAQEVSSSDQ